MSYSILPCLFTLYITICVQSVVCDCEKSYTVICDSVNDLLHISNVTKQSWTEVLIEHNGCTYWNPQYILTPKHLENFNSLERLVIVGQLLKIESRSFYHTLKTSLKYLVVYGNNFETLPTYTFWGYHNLTTLNLARNGLKRIQRQAFFFCKIGTLDLSNNNLRSLRSRTFGECDVDKLIITHNNLSTIGQHALPTGLKFLHLDYNNFQFLSSTNFNKSFTLEEFSISHNKLTFLDELPLLTSLKKFDASFNSIHRVGGEFDKAVNLNVLNLSGNNLIKFSFPSFLIFQRSQFLYVFLAYNRLRSLNLKPVGMQPVALALSGNPWNCKCVEEMEKFLTNPTKKIRKSKCDEYLFGCGKVPYCLVSEPHVKECTDDNVLEEEYELFKKNYKTEHCDAAYPTEF